jgi:hypothetical protein
VSRVNGQAPAGKRITGSAGASPDGDGVWSAYSDGVYGQGEFSDWPPPQIGSGVSGRERSSMTTGGRR